MKSLKVKTTKRRTNKSSYKRINQDNVEVLQRLGFKKSATRLNEKLKKIERAQRTVGDGLNCKRRRAIERNLVNVITVKR